METPQPRRSMDWQSQAHKARRQRGFIEGSVTLSQFEKWTLDNARAVTGIAPNQWLKLCAVGDDWTIDRIEAEVAHLAYSLEEARKCNLQSLERAEAEIKSYASNIRHQLSQIEEQTRSQWEALQGVRS